MRIGLVAGSGPMRGRERRTVHWAGAVAVARPGDRSPLRRVAGPPRGALPPGPRKGEHRASAGRVAQPEAAAH
jgi:hypothetical protein